MRLRSIPRLHLLALVPVAGLLAGCPPQPPSENPIGSGGNAGAGGASSSTTSSTSSGEQQTGGAGGAGGTGGISGTGGMAGSGGAAGAGGNGCLPGTLQSCYPGPNGTVNVGLCKAGVTTCLADGSWGPCEGAVLPQIENTGTPEDESCDGGDECLGNVLWTMRLGADTPQQGQPPPYEEAIFGAATLDNGDTLLSGRLYGSSFTYAPGKSVGPGAFFLRLDSQGVVKNSITFPTLWTSSARSLFPAPDGGFFLFWTDELPSFSPITYHLARYDANDTLQFDHTFTAPTLSFNGLVVLPNGNARVLGSWRGTATLDAITLQGPSEYNSLVLLELDAAGAALSAKTFNHIDSAQAGSLLLASNGDLLVSGRFGGYKVSGILNLGGNPLMAPGYYDSYYGRLTASGAHVWSRHVTQTGGAFGTLAAIAPEGTILLAGNEATFDPSSITTINLGAGPIDVEGKNFLARLDENGDPVSTIVTSAIAFESLKPLAGGDIHFTSNFMAPAPIDVLGKMAASISGSRDLLIGTLGPDDKLKHACIYGTERREGGYAVGLTPDGAYVVIGSFETALDLGKGTMTSVGATDLFLAKIKP